MRWYAPLFFLFTLSWAQIQIQSSDLPAPSSSYTVSQSRPQPGWDFTATGANFSWDFSTLPVDTQLTIEWKSPLQVPQYFFSCGNASLQALLLKVADSFPSQGGISIRDIYAFLRKSSSQLAIHGVGASVNGVPITQCYQDPDELYMLPLSYARQDSTTFWLRLTFSIPNAGTATLAQRGYRLHEVDGYGQVATPYGQYPCLRLRRKVHQRDTLYINGFPLQRRDTSYIEYEWLGEDQGVPLLRVQGNIVGPGGGTFVPVVIQFKDVPRANALLGGGTVRLSPNPTRGILHVPAPGARYKVLNLIGKVVQEGEIPSDGYLRLAPHLSEGVYFLYLVQGRQESWHRFVLLAE